MVPIVVAFSMAQTQSASRQKTDPTSAESRSQGYDLEISDNLIVRGGLSPGKTTASLANVIDAVRERYPEANIVVAPGLGNVPIANLKLRTGNIWEELEAVRVASGGRFEWSGPNSPTFGRPDSPSPSRFGTAPGPVDPATGLPTDAAVSNNKGMFAIHAPTPTPETERIVEAFNIGAYLRIAAHPEDSEGQSANKKESQEVQTHRAQESLEQVKEIITQTIAALHPEHVPDSPRFQFHRGANVLVVIGSHNEVDVARKVINALPGQSHIALALTGNGVPETGMSSAEREAFRRRYGLSSPGAVQDPPNNDELFRRRYGLGPNPASPQKPQDSKPEQ